MRVLILSFLSLVLISCGSNRINNTQLSTADTFSDETFMRFGHARLRSIKNRNIMINSLVQCYRGNYSKGLKDLQKSLVKYRDNPKYWLYIGNCYQLYGNSLKANHFYDYALSGPAHVKSAIFNNRALMAMKAHNYEEAQTLLSKSIKLTSSHKVPKFNLAQLYIKFNETKKARQLLAGYLTHSTSDVDLIFSMMSIELAEGNLQAALKWSKKFKQNDLKREDISLYRSLLYVELGQFKKAKDSLGLQRPTVIKEIIQASNILNSKIDQELKRLQEIEKKNKGVRSVVVKN
ncbi:hypothetical protein A9Q84_12355 [Halobacteriovorax marinus]|uniref:Uncharacterized protein n=1 Tax=Halobacteriovorax marinus TaxID=97084 RepID=A0A1Y5F8M6_9BACT|nr:hypothetical protein A9Q84_12355 [Halobacteriovorax marinus]